ncbi:MAG: hypothetical protein HYV07_17995 [Deltaproteobacteria bacterium]|nr:hypothetical protein [Deltaproteobacteria bacterium]
MSWLFPLLLASAAPLRIEATIADDLRSLEVTIRTEIEPGERVWLFADRYRAPPSTRPETLRELFPSGFSTGGFEVRSISVGGLACRVEASPEDVDRGLEVCGSGALVVATTLRVPERFGAFGVIDSALTLAGGWYPVVARPGAAAPRRDVSIEVSIPGHVLALVGHEPFFPAGARRTVRTELSLARTVPLVIRPPTARAVSIAGGRAHLIAGPASELELPGRSPRIASLVSALEDGFAFVEELGLDRVSHVVVVEAPLRHELSERSEGVLFVSDRAFRLTPFARFLKFHRIALLRDLFGAISERRVEEESRAEARPPLTRSVMSDAIGAALVDAYVGSRFGGSEDAFDVLGAFSFIPSIDSMLYAPDLPFVAAYFRVIREDDPLHVDFVDAPLRVPRGKLLYEKLSDRMGAKAAREALLAARVAAEAFAGLGASQASFLRSWLGPYPDVRYGLLDFDSHVEGSSFRATARLERRGATVAEPVVVKLTDEEGNDRLVESPASDDRVRTVTATLGAPLSRVELDPFHRLAESPSEADPSPRFDNRSDASWKVLLNNFNLLISATEGEVDTAIDLGFSRRYDVEEGFAIRADYAPRAIGLSGRWRRSFGEAVTPARLEQSFVLTLGGEYLRAGFSEGAGAGAAGSAALSYGFDDRTSAWAPETGSGIRAAATYSHVFGLPEGAGGPTRDALALSLRALRQWRLGARHQLALRGALGSYVLGRPRDQLAFPLGGRGNVRGYALSAKLTRHRALASVEWLHPLAPTLELDGLSLFFVGGIDGALFADVAVASDELERIGDGPLYSDVGYGLRVYFDYAGVRPAVMAIDVAWPIERPPRGEWLPAVYIDFSQSFLAF